MKGWAMLLALALLVSGAWATEELADFVTSAVTNSTYTYTAKDDVDLGRVDIHFNASSTATMTVYRVVSGTMTNLVSTESITAGTDASYVPDEGRLLLRRDDSLQVTVTEAATNVAQLAVDFRNVK